MACRGVAGAGPANMARAVSPRGTKTDAKVKTDLKFNRELLTRLRQALAPAGVRRLPALPFSAAAFLAAEIRRALQRGVVAVTDSLRTLEEFQRHLEVFCAPHEILRLPAEDISAGRERAAEVGRLGGERAQVLYKISQTPRPLVATCIQALMQTVPPAASLREMALRLLPGARHDPVSLMEMLAKQGYEVTAEVQSSGQAARRGGLLDVWPPGMEWPCRLEFYGETLESLRWFDPLTQRSQARANELVLLAEPAGGGSPAATGPWETPVKQMPADAVYLWFEPAGDAAEAPGGVAGIEAHAEMLLQAAPEALAAGRPAPLSEVRAVLAEFARKPPGARELHIGGIVTPDPAQALDLAFRPLPPMFSGGERSLAPDVFESERRKWLEDLERMARHGRRVCVFFGSVGGLERFRELYPRLQFELRLGALADGFDNDLLGLTVVSESNLIGRRKRLPGILNRQAARRAALNAAGETITDAMKLEPGDLVVHVEHGIGRYLGIYEVEFNGKRQEALTLEYADQARLYVPVSQAHLLSRYIGAGRPHAVTLHRLGGGRWRREKRAAEMAVRDLAAGLLETQALRNARPGYAFPADTAWQHEFEAAFPFHETEDQERAIREVKRDMQAPRPMDRLVCGDAGYGKTEVAMRAAFKCVIAGRQAAMLVPTTVLAQQHFDSFRERLTDYPVRVELLSRFQSPGVQARIIRDLRSGAVDIVIGTHRLVQPDVAFKDLGLVIIDEEQRFGVEHKERLKHMKQLVDVLTLTATPIPRTLYLSLTGAREISVIQTPPRERQPIETIIARYDDALIRAAILRELNRGGQVYFLYNRVMTIQRMADRLRRLAPEARLGVGHGQMAAGELARVVRAFAEGHLDLLLCTTIIESGMDISNANTIIIDRADRFGMAELYQLRGRVGRANRKAYAYLLLPPHGNLLSDARRRLGAIVEYSGAGAGFRLALRDLEIRGAGNLLGAAQSGHIAAVGFELYCQLLRQAVAAVTGARGGAPPPIVNVELNLDFIEFSPMAADAGSGAFLPADYMEDERLRLDFFRRLASAGLDELPALRAELADRFGPLPPPAARLLQLADLRQRAAAAGITGVEVRAGRVMLRRGGGYVQQRHQFPRLRGGSADERLAELAELLAAV